VHDPWADSREAEEWYGVTMIEELPENRYDAVVLAVAHREFAAFSKADFERTCSPLSVVYDVKHVLASDIADSCL
jgi:UDP-N-acetyl-D-galactosamine dehydrogenase